MLSRWYASNERNRGTLQTNINIYNEEFRKSNMKINKEKRKEIVIWVTDMMLEQMTMKKLKNAKTGELFNTIR